MDRDAERRFAEYDGYQLVAKDVPPQPVKPTLLPPPPSPKETWEEVAVDLLGLLPYGKHLLVIVDYHSRWMEVDVIRTTSSKTHHSLPGYSRHRFPRGLLTDNGSNFVSRSEKSI